MKFDSDYGKFTDLIKKLEGDGNSHRPYRSSEVACINNNGEVLHYVEFTINLPQYGCFIVSDCQRTGIGTYYGGFNSTIVAYGNKIRIYDDKVIALMNSKVIYESNRHHIKGNYENSELIINVQYKHLK